MNYPTQSSKPALAVTDKMQSLCKRILFAGAQSASDTSFKLSADLFDSLAQDIAVELNRSSGDCNKPTQIRRFYDELVSWEERLAGSKEKFEANEAFFRMLNAKVAYAFGRGRDERKSKPGLVDDNFRHWFSACMRETTSSQPQTLRYFRMHFEAVLGFLRALRDK